MPLDLLLLPPAQKFGHEPKFFDLCVRSKFSIGFNCIETLAGCAWPIADGGTRKCHFSYGMVECKRACVKWSWQHRLKGKACNALSHSALRIIAPTVLAYFVGSFLLFALALWYLRPFYGAPGIRQCIFCSAIIAADDALWWLTTFYGLHHI